MADFRTAALDVSPHDGGAQRYDIRNGDFAGGFVPGVTTDAISMIQSAVTKIKTAGRGTLYLPGGVIPVSEAPVIDADYVSIEGAGRQHTKLLLTGSGPGLIIDGSGSQIRECFFRDFTVTTADDNSLSTHGIYAVDLGFACQFMRVEAENFASRGFYLIDCDNTGFFTCFVEGAGVTEYAFYLQRAYGHTLLNCETHYTKATTGAGVYATLFNGLGIYGGVFEGGGFGGSPITTGYGIVLTTADGVGGATISSPYIERTDTGILLNGTLADPCRNVKIQGGKVSGTVDVCVDTDYAENCSIEQMHLQVPGTLTNNNYVRTSANSKDIDIGVNTYYGTGTIDDQQPVPVKKRTSRIFWTTGNKPILVDLDGVTANDSYQDLTPTAVDGDPRRILAAIVSLRFTVNTVGSAGTECSLRVRPKGATGAHSEAMIFTINDAAVVTGGIYDAQCECPCNASGLMEYQRLVGSGWNVDIDIRQVGVVC